MMRCTHHDSHPVGQHTVLLVIVVECASPHCRPHEIAFQTQQELEYALITSAVDSSELLHSPVSEGRPFVVDEYAPVCHLRLSIGVDAAAADIDVFMLCNRHIHPPIPWRYSYLA